MATSVAFLLAALSPAATAEAGWSAPVTVAKGDDGGYRVLLTTSPSRGSTVAWHQGSVGTFGRRIASNGVLGTARKLLGTEAAIEGPWMAVDRKGVTVLVWYRFEAGAYSLRARRMSARGKVGPIRKLAGPFGLDNGSSNEPGLAMDAAGNAIVAWPEVVYALRPGDPPDLPSIVSATIHVRRFNANGTLGPMIDVPDPDGRGQVPRIALEPSGRATAVWSSRGQSGCGTCTVRIARDGTLGAVRQLAPLEPGLAGTADLAVAPSGRAVFVWTTSSPWGGVVVRRMARAGGIGPARLLGHQMSYGRARIAMDRAGNATIAWLGKGKSRGGPGVIQSRRIWANDSLGGLLTMSRPVDYSSPELAVERSGRATVVWRRPANPASARPSPPAIEARQVSPQGRLSAVHTLVRSRRAFRWLGSYGVVADARGVVTAAWSRSAGSRFVVEAARLVRRR